MDSTNGTAPEPVFNFTGLGRQWGKRWMHTLTRTTKLQLELQQTQHQLEEAANGDEEGARKKIEQQMALLDEFEALSAEQECLLAQVLVEVPAEWISRDAPPEINWSDPSSLDWVQELAYPQLIQALNTARQHSSKN